MSAITYTAKRGIELSGFSAAGIDISASTTDDSFNTGASSPLTPLNGGLDDEWILVSGFTDALNNGWYQINGTPTATKIIQDTGNLATEAAGDAVVITGYKRGFDQSYSIDLVTNQRNRSVKSSSNISTSLSGVRETLFNNREEIWSVSLKPVLIANMGQIREFIESVMGGESFTFDPYGSVAVPDNPLSCTLESKSYQESEIDFTGYVRVSFQIRYVP